MNNKPIITVVGVDIGASTAKIAAVQRGAIDVITNQANFRQTPVVVGFGQGQRKIGEIGSVKLKSNFKNTIVSPIRYLGLSNDQSNLNKELSFCTCPTKFQDDTLFFKVDLNGKQQNFTPQQVMGCFMTQVSQILHHNNLDEKMIVFSVPSFFTQIQKTALLNAAEISGMKNVKLVSDSVAIGLDYGSFKKSQMGQGKNVLFMDFGHSKLSLSLIKFTESKMEVFMQKSNRNLGCRDLDKSIFDFIAKKFQQSKGLNIRQNKKACLKLLQVIQKQRKILSGISETDISIQCLMEDEDLSQPFTRQTFFKECSEVFNEIKYLLSSFKQQVQKINLKIDSIELVGGGSRIPKFIQIVEQIFGITCSRTINSNETIARGATLAAVQQSGLFRFHSFKITNKLAHSIGISWKNNDETQQNQIIINKGQLIPAEKWIKIQTNKNIQIQVFHDIKDESIQKKIAKLECQAPQNKDQINLKFVVDQDGFVNISSVKDNDKVDIKFVFRPFKGLTPQKLSAFKAKQREMFVKDFSIIKSYEKKNELQAFIYKKRQILNDEQIKKHITNQEKQKIQKYLNQIAQELNNGQINEYENKKKQVQIEIKKLQEISKKRKGQLILHIKELEDLKNVASETIKQICQRFRNTKTVTEVIQQIKGIQDWASQAIKLTKQKPINELPAVPKRDIEQQHQNIKILVNQLVNPQRQEHQPQQQQRRQQAPPQYHEQPRRKPQQQQYYDPFGMTRSGFFGPSNNFFGNMGGFF